ncbi:hypothetical protein [Archangium sp.]|jgi:hypothetical protein|uniref:hypothetical protein n=1 Tax=Archangium sp. TaxID=1872627 RepID=UPI002ED966D3
MNPIKRLAEVAAEAGELWCLCDLQKGKQRIELCLRSRNGQKSVEASACYKANGTWKVEQEEVSTLEAGIHALAARWKGKLQPNTLRAGMKKSPVRGEGLEALLRAAFHQAFEGRVPAETQEVYERLALQKAAPKAAPKAKARASKKKAEPTTAPPPSLLEEVRDEPAFLARQRASLAARWGFKRRDSVLAMVELATQLYALDRADEALDLAQAVMAAFPTQDRAPDLLYFWSAAIDAAALSAHVLEARGDGSGQAEFEARVFANGSKEGKSENSFEVVSKTGVEQALLDLWVVAFNARHHPEIAQTRAVALLSTSLQHARLRQRLARLAPYSTWYSGSALEPVVGLLTGALRSRLMNKKAEPPPPGYTPLSLMTVDVRWSLAFESDGSLAATAKEARCKHCKEPLRTARCVVCPASFVVRTSKKKARTPFSCDAHDPLSAGGTLVVHEQKGTLQRKCPHCEKEVLPFPLRS